METGALSVVSPVMAILSDAKHREFAYQIAHALGYDSAEVVIGSILEGTDALKHTPRSPDYLIVEIGNRGDDILPELDGLAEYCEHHTRVVVIGNVNDVTLYRELRQRGVLEYFTHPAKIQDIRTVLMYDGGVKATSGDTLAITFCSAASGDGSSTVALNTAYSIAAETHKPTVLIDMDFQFGMIARNLDLGARFGIRDIFEHPDRSVDSVLIERMVVSYSNDLHLITAPTDLRLWPEVRPETIRDLMIALREKFSYILIDLPHTWSPWVAAALNDANLNVLVTQLWLRSLTHASRLIPAWREVGVTDDRLIAVSNRTGAKFKEGLTARDFERVCKHPIEYQFTNDIKAVVAAENRGQTIPELGNSLIARQFQDFASFIIQEYQKGGNTRNAAASQ